MPFVTFVEGVGENEIARRSMEQIPRRGDFVRFGPNVEEYNVLWVRWNIDYLAVTIGLESGWRLSK